MCLAFVVDSPSSYHAGVSPETHLLASWVLAAKTTDNPRDCRLVALAGIMPDLDGLGLVLDLGRQAAGISDTYYYYAQYHHYLLHGALGAVLVAAFMTLFARRHLRVALLCLVAFHLHLVCDFVGSRGPDPVDLWAIYYFGPFQRDPMWVWSGQWRLDGWMNRTISFTLLFYAFWLAVNLGHSFIGVFSRRVDAIVVPVLQKWTRQIKAALNFGEHGTG
jgi:hypothetical protein